MLPTTPQWRINNDKGVVILLIRVILIITMILPFPSSGIQIRRENVTRLLGWCRLNIVGLLGCYFGDSSVFYWPSQIGQSSTSVVVTAALPRSFDSQLKT